MQNFPGVRSVTFVKRDENYTYNQEIEDGICLQCKGDDVECLEDCTTHVCVNCKFTIWNVTDTSYTAWYVGMPCVECGESVDGEGVFSTGAPLEHHKPLPGELLKNIGMECSNCDWNQYS